jgi:hypothetical protein
LKKIVDGRTDVKIWVDEADLPAEVLADLPLDRRETKWLDMDRSIGVHDEAC